MNFAFESFSAFLAMGKYAAFVWPCIALTVLSFLWLLVSEKRQYRKLSAAMERQGISMTKENKNNKQR